MSPSCVPDVHPKLWRVESDASRSANRASNGDVGKVEQSHTSLAVNLNIDPRHDHAMFNQLPGNTTTGAFSHQLETNGKRNHGKTSSWPIGVATFWPYFWFWTSENDPTNPDGSVRYPEYDHVCCVSVFCERCCVDWPGLLTARVIDVSFT